MKTKWYRSNFMKALWLFLAHAGFVGAALCGILLIALYANGIRPGDSGKSYIQSNSFEEQFYNSTLSVFHNLKDFIKFWDSENGQIGEIVDLKELSDGEPFTFRNVSGLAYRTEDLVSWAQSSWDFDYAPYDNNTNIVVCLKPNETYEYFYFKDFAQKVADGEFVLKTDPAYIGAYLNETYGDGDWIDSGSDGTVIPSAWQNSAEEEIQEQAMDLLRNMLAYGDADGSFNEIGISEIQDAQGKTLYRNVWNYDGNIVVEKFPPQGASSILDVVNKSPKWNGHLTEAFCELNNALSLAMDLASDQTAFASENTNLTYLFADKKNGTFYSNSKDYSISTQLSLYLEDIKKSDAYVILVPDIAQCDTNLESLNNKRLSSTRSELRNWLHLAEDFFQDSDFVLAIRVDTQFPVHDYLAQSRDFYEQYSDWFTPLLTVFCFGVLFFLAGLVWLTIAAGRRTNDDEVHFNFFDHIYTEIAAAVIVLLWIGVMYHVVQNVRLDMDVIQSYNFVVVSLCGLYTAILFFIGYLSFVRRIKGKTLWKNSLLCKVLQLFRKILKNIKPFPGTALKRIFSIPKGIWHKLKSIADIYSRNTGTRIKMTILITAFLLLQTFLSVFIYEAAFFIIPVIILDAAMLAYIIRKSAGQERIMNGLKKISSGELTYKIPMDKLTGDQKFMAEFINNIGSGLDAAVEKSVKNERMKTELITNVSHDIKTPLTSIINYVDLLNRENFTDPKIRGYLDILAEKSQRLKILTEDIVEASKASTGNITLEMTELDYNELVHQVIGEFQERFQNKNLALMVHFTEEPSVIYADGRRMWRVLENIFTNVVKYAMEGTRVYAETLREGQKVIFSLKNISSQPLNISADELTERFIRGDSSRNTEGSGLGLSIAKSLTELQGGKFEVYVDGDLFKVTILFVVKS